MVIRGLAPQRHHLLPTPQLMVWGGGFDGSCEPPEAAGGGAFRHDPRRRSKGGARSRGPLRPVGAPALAVGFRSSPSGPSCPLHRNPCFIQRRSSAQWLTAPILPQSSARSPTMNRSRPASSTWLVAMPAFAGTLGLAGRPDLVGPWREWARRHELESFRCGAQRQHDHPRRQVASCR